MWKPNHSSDHKEIDMSSVWKFRYAVVVTLTCVLGVALARVLYAQSTIFAYDSMLTIDADCTGPAIACGNSPSIDCDDGQICEGIPSLMVPTCAPAPAGWFFGSICARSGTECPNGRCQGGGSCFNTQPFMCSSTTWYFWNP